MKPTYFSEMDTIDEDPIDIDNPWDYPFESEMILLTSSGKKSIIDCLPSNLVDLNTQLIDYIMQSSMNDIYFIESEYSNKIVKLMIIPTLEIGVDLVNLKKDELFSKLFIERLVEDGGKTESYYDDLMENLIISALKKHDDPKLNKIADSNGNWTFYTIDDAICKNGDNYFISLNISKKLNKPYQRFWKGDNIIITRDSKIACAPMVSFFLNSLFKGERNWAFGQSYNDVFKKLKESRLEEDVMCYEHLNDFTEEEYTITENKPLEVKCLNEYSSDKIIILFSLLDSDYESVRFLGKYKIDKEASKEKGHLSFKSELQSYL